MFVADGFVAPLGASPSLDTSGDTLSWSAGFLTVAVEAGVGGTMVVAVVGVGVVDGVGVELLWLPASSGAVSLDESYGESMREPRQ